MSAMKLVHALAALLTAILLYIKQWSAVCAGANPAKGGAMQASPCSWGDTPLTSVPLLTGDRIKWTARATRCNEECGQPKYKRDPEISIDNENIGQQPHDF